MPTYQYVCTGECGQLLEAVQSFSDAPLEECPTCGGRLRKKFSAVGVVFKGSGFYRTDSRSGSGSGSASSTPAKDTGSSSGAGSGGGDGGSSSTPSGTSSTPSGTSASGTGSSGSSASPAKSA